MCACCSHFVLNLRGNFKKCRFVKDLVRSKSGISIQSQQDISLYKVLSAYAVNLSFAWKLLWEKDIGIIEGNKFNGGRLLIVPEGWRSFARQK